jgi:hypothetical protein
VCEDCCDKLHERKVSGHVDQYVCASSLPFTDPL